MNCGYHNELPERAEIPMKTAYPPVNSSLLNFLSLSHHLLHTKFLLLLSSISFFSEALKPFSETTRYYRLRLEHTQSIRDLVRYENTDSR